MQRQLEARTLTSTVQMSVVGTKLLDKYVLPKVAMALILVSSAAGVWVSLRGFGAVLPGLVLAKWVHLIGLSIVGGGGLWGAYYTRNRYDEHDVEAPAGFLRLEFARFGSIQLYAAVAALASGIYAAIGYSILFGDFYAPWYDLLIIVQVALWLGLVSLAAIARLQVKRGSDALRLQGWLKATALLALLSLLGTATLDVLPYQGIDGQAVAARWMHLAALGVWFGGAIWNVFVAVPAARRTLGFETVFAAASQLEHFRKVVRVALPLVVLSGVYQTYGLVGVDVSVLLGLSLGLVILAKVGLIILLVGIFLTCPMWRACSPIAGVCDITDIHPTPRTGGPGTQLGQRNGHGRTVP